MSDDEIKSPFEEKNPVLAALLDLGDEIRRDQEREHKELLENPALGSKLIDGITLAKVGRDYMCGVSIPQGHVKIVYSEILRSRQSFDTVISVQLIHSKEGTLPAFEQRLDLNSASGISNFVTSLNGAYGGKKENYNWTLILNRANNVLKQTLLEEKKPINVMGREFSSSSFLLKPFLQENEANMVFGNSEVGKTYFALYMAACAAAKRDFFGNETKPFKTLMLDYEDSVGSLTNRLHELSRGLEMPFDTLATAIEYYKPEASLKEETEIVAKMVEANGYSLVIIDAGADASGGSPNDETKVLEMFNALNNIPCTKLIIHHEPKNVIGLSPENAYYGTAFWRSRCRTVWRLTVEEHDGYKKTVKAVMTKGNNMAPVPPFTYTMTWGGDTIGKPSIRFESVDDFKPSDEKRIIDFLIEGGEATTEQIADACAMTIPTAKRKLSGMLEKEQIDRRRDIRHSRRVLWFIPGKGGVDNETF